MGNKTVLDWLREMAQPSQKPTQQCRRTPLPPFWELPRWLGAVSGCLEKIGGADYIVVQGESKGLKLKYKILKDVVPLVQNKARQRGVDRSNCIPQYFADALYELAARSEIALVGCHAVIDGVEVYPQVCSSRAPERCAVEILQYIKETKPKLKRAKRIEEVYGQLLQLLRGECRHTINFVSNPWWLRDLWEREERFVQLSTWCEAERVLRRYNLDFVIARLYNTEREQLREFAVVRIGDMPCAVINGGAWCRGAKYYSVKREGGDIHLCRDGECLRAEVLEPPSFSPPHFYLTLSTKI